MKALLVAIAGGVLLPVLMLVGLVVISPSIQHGGAAAPGVVCTPAATPAGEVVGYRGEQLDVAAQIVAAGREMGLPEKAWVIAVATAMQESRLRPLDYGDAAGPDSRGVFQQRTSWGPEEVRKDPKGSAKLFFERLIALDPPWDSTQLSSVDNPAQRVQRSAFPLKYAEHEAAAREVVGAVLGVHCPAPGPPGGGPPPHPRAREVIDRAVAQVGVRYAWGGGGTNGPSVGTGVDAGVSGFDCSGLAQHAWAAVGVDVPRQTQAIWQRFQRARIERDQLQSGDLVLLSDNGSPTGIHHVGIYMGNAEIVEAPQSGQLVQVRRNVWAPESNYTREFFAGVRPGVAVPGSTLVNRAGW